MIFLPREAEEGDRLAGRFAPHPQHLPYRRALRATFPGSRRLRT